MNSVSHPGHEPRIQEAKFLRALLDTAAILVLVIDAEGRVTFFNRAFENKTGYALDEVRGKLYWDVFLPPKDILGAKSILEAIAFSKISAQYESHWQMKSGEQRLIAWACTPMLNSSGEVEFIAATGIDITDRQQAEESLRQRHRSLHLIIASMPHLLLVVDQESHVSAFFVPAGFPTLLNLSVLADGQSLAQIASSDLVEVLTQLGGDASASKRTSTLQYSMASESGKSGTLYFEIQASPITDSTDILMVIDNITDLKRAEMAEHEQRVLAEALRDTATALNSTLHLDEVIDRILGNVGRVVPESTVNLLLLEEGTARVVRSFSRDDSSVERAMSTLQLSLDTTPNLRRMAETGQPVVVPNVEDDPTWIDLPETRWVRSHVGAPIRLEERVIGFLTLLSPTPNFFSETHGRQLQTFADQAAIAIQNATLYEDLNRRTVELEHINRELDAFSYTVAHDLMTPLLFAAGYASVLRDFKESLPSEAAQCIEGIGSAMTKMNRIIESLLLLAKLRNVDETITLVEMKPTIEAALDRVRAKVQQHKVEVCVAEDLPSVMGYGPWLEEVFANLIDNSVKYIGDQNSNPQVVISAAKQNGVVRYQVQDNGLGIAPADQVHLFEMFTRFHSSAASGTGLGLSIIHRIITKMHGQIGVESAVGQGSTFWFTLPAATCPDPT